MPRKQNHTAIHYLFTIFYYFFHSLVGAVVWVLIGFGGYYIFQAKKSPYDVIIGLPLLLISIGFLVNDLWSDLLSIFSPTFNRGVCVWCNKE